jgi:hypothetical protein
VSHRILKLIVSLLMKIQVTGEVTPCGWVNSSQKFKGSYCFLLYGQAGQDTIMQDVTNIFKSSCQLKTLGVRPSTIAVADVICAHARTCVWVCVRERERARERGVNHKILIHIEDILLK